MQSEVKSLRSGRLKILVRMGTMIEDKNLKGYVIALDDITNLVSAQRSAAGGDVARELLMKSKILSLNTLSAERIRKKFSPLLLMRQRFNKW